MTHEHPAEDNSLTKRELRGAIVRYVVGLGEETASLRARLEAAERERDEWRARVKAANAALVEVVKALGILWAWAAHGEEEVVKEP